MKSKKFSRRDFSQLSMAAIGGLCAGSSALAQDSKGGGVHVDPSLLLRDQPNVCRGLNTCKTHGKGKHDCAGQGSCATAPSITCHANNDCKGNGGCGGYPGQNTCKKRGHCNVPLNEKTWPIARAQFEHLMKDAGKKFGNAPKK